MTDLALYDDDCAGDDGPTAEQLADVDKLVIERIKVTAIADPFERRAAAVRFQERLAGRG